MKIYEVGGAVRDRLMGKESKDVDFAVEAESFEDMSAELVSRGFKIFQSTPEYLTIRAQVPKSETALYARTKAADFVLCRKDGIYKDGRHPESVEQGTILDDLARRDFTINAIAIDPETGEFIDPHGGIRDLKTDTLKFVGNSMDRIEEDGLRVLRGYRFMVTKHLSAHYETSIALHSELAGAMLGKVSIERVREELKKMFAFDTMRSMILLASLPHHITSAIFRDGLRLEPTLKD